MKKPTLFGFLVIFLTLGLAVTPLSFGQGYDAASQFSFKDTGNKPEKKTPEKQGNFEVIQGKQIKAPIDRKKFADAAKVSLAMLQANQKYYTTIHEEGAGFIFFRARKTPAWVDIKLCYWDDEYWFEYWDSYKFVADPAKNVIHKTYRGVIIYSLEKALRASYK